MLLQAIPPAPPAAVAPSTQIDPLTVTGVKPGTARLSCAIRGDRSVDRCVVLSAEPANCGFGTAALRLAEHLKLDPAAKARGGKVEIPLSFSGIGGCPRPDTP